MFKEFSFSNISRVEREACLNNYDTWLLSQMGKLQEGIAAPERLLHSTMVMRDNLADIFSTNYQGVDPPIVIFSGRSAPLHRFIFDRAFAQAQKRAQLQRPEHLFFDDWQNQNLYVNRNSSTPNILDSPDPIQVLQELKAQGVKVAIHEDHTRLGGKHTSLIEHWKRGLFDQIFQYSAPVYPDYHWVRDFYFGLREEWYNRFFSGYSKLYSQREFYKLHGFMEVLDAKQGHIISNETSGFKEAMEILQEASDLIGQALFL